MEDRQAGDPSVVVQGGMVVAEEPEASALDFVVVADLPEELPLDRIVTCEREMAGVGKIRFWGMVEAAGYGELYYGLVRVIRIYPEVFVPPIPGIAVSTANAENVAWALRFTTMKQKFVIGQLTDEQPAYANFDFVSGTKGAHVNIAGISGVATKTSYALFLLYSLFAAQPQLRSIIFNVKGDDLLYLDKPNCKMPTKDREMYTKLGLPCGPFAEVAYFGLKTGLWTLWQFAERELIRYLFEDTEESGVMQGAIDRLAERLREAAGECEGPGVILEGEAVEDLAALVKFLDKLPEKNAWFEGSTLGTRKALMRRLKAGARQVSALITADGRFDYEAQLSVVDIHALSDRARAFVVGAVMRSVYEGREKLGGAHPTTLVILDELNKYAPKRGGGPIKEMLLDVAERGRSLGIVLIGAEQTASQVEERVVGNAALRVVGRLETAESEQPSYGWLSGTLRRRSTLLLPGTMVVAQPEVPVPLVVRFPFPAWATRQSEVLAKGMSGAPPFEGDAPPE